LAGLLEFSRRDEPDDISRIGVRTRREDATVALNEPGDKRGLGLVDRPASPSSSTGMSATRRAGMSAATSTFLRRTMPMSTTASRAARKKPWSPGSSSVSSRRIISSVSGFLSSIQPRNCQIIRKSSIWLISGVPVRAIISALGVTARMLFESDCTFFERCESLFLMKCASSTTMPLKPRRDSQATWRSSTS